MPKKLMIVAVALGLAILGLAACGGDDDDAAIDEPPAAPAPGELNIEADSVGLNEYTTGELTIEAGTVTINFDNPAVAAPHDVVIEDADGNDIGGTEVITNDSTTATVELEPGTYTYYCSVPGHREDGMEETLIVE